MTSSYVTPEQVAAARRRLGLAPQQTDVGFQSTQPESKPSEPKRGKSLAARAADGFRAVVPQQARDAVGFTFNELDKPLSQRAGFRIPEMRGPLDEIGNTVVEELTRPSTLLIAAGGAGAAAKLGTLGRGGKIAAGLIAPAGGTNLATRTLAGGAVSAGARGGSSVVQDALPEDTPTPARVLLGLGAGVFGGAATLGATRAGVRSAVGKDILSPDLGAGYNAFRPTIKDIPTEAGTRKGNLIRLAGADQISSLKDFNQMLLTSRKDVESGVQFAVSTVRDAVRRLGVETGKDGYEYIKGVRDAAGRPALLGDVLEFKAKASRPQVDSLFSKVQRVEGPGGVPSFDKPQGLYLTPGAGESPYAGQGGRTYRYDTNPNARVLTISGPGEEIPGALIESTGTQAIVRLGGQSELQRLVGLPVDELVRELRAEFPDADWGRYVGTFRPDADPKFVQRDLLEALGGLRAKASGYDAIAMVDPANPEWSEFVALTAKALLPEGSAASADHFSLTPEQAKAVDDIRRIVDLAAEDARLFGHPPKTTKLVEGQSYIPRAITEEAKQKGGGRGLRFVPEETRTYQTFREGVDGGAKYAPIANAVEFYARRQLTNAARANVIDAAKKVEALDAFRIEDAIPQDLLEAVKKLTAAARGRRKTYIAQKARAGAFGRVAEQRVSASERGLERVSKSAERADARAAAAPTPEDIAETTARTASLITEGRDLAVRAQRNLDAVRPLRKSVSNQDTAIQSQIDDLVKQLDEAGDGTDVSRIERRIESLSAKADALEDRLDTAILKGETLREMDINSRVELVQSRRQERTMAYLDKLSAKADVELKQLEREQARLTADATRAGARTAEEVAKAAKTGADYDALRDGLRNARERLKWAKAAAQNRPPDRVRIPVDVAPGLQGYDFPKDVGERIINFYRQGEIPRDPQLGTTVGILQTLNRNTTAATAIGDASSLGNQLALFAVSHPLKFTANVAKSVRDAFQPAAYDRFLAEQAQDGAAHGLAILGSAAAPTEFQFTSWLARVPAFKQAQQFFEASTTRNRVDVYNQFVDIAAKRGEPLNDLAKEQLARALNRFSGISNNQAGTVETLTEFAANYMRSGLETVSTAAVDGTIEGSLARQYMRNLVAMGQLTVAAAATGFIPGTEKRDMDSVMNPLDLKALARGEVKMNPNFGTIRMFGQDVSVYGRFDSLARLATVSADAVTRSIAEQDAAQLFDALGYAAGTKANVPIRFATDIIKGGTFAGDDPLTVQNVLLSVTPFSVSAFIQDLKEGQPLGIAAAGGAISFLGGKSNPLTTTERMDNLSRAIYGRPLDDLTGGERQRLEQTSPELVKEYRRNLEQRAEQGDPGSVARLGNLRADERRLEDEKKLALAYQSGEVSGADFREAVEQLQFRTATEKQQNERLMNPDRQLPTGADAAVSEWYATYDKAEVAPGILDWDLRDKLEQELFARIQAGEFDDPVRAMAHIEDRKKVNHPDLQWYFDAKAQISESGYYGVKDTRLAPFRQTASRIYGAPVETYDDLTKAIDLTTRKGDKRTATSLKAVKSRVDFAVSRDQKVMRLRDPNLDDALVRARGLVPIRQQR